MLSALFAEAGIDHAGIAMGILYRGPSPSNRTLHESPATSPPIQPAAPPARHLIPSPVGPQLPDGNPAGPRMSADEHGGENRTGELAGEGGPALEVPTEEVAGGANVRPPCFRAGSTPVARTPSGPHALL
jgi:hypothetical protein